MPYYCPNCGARMDYNIVFEITGECPCHECGEMVDRTTVSTAPLDEDRGEDPFGDDSDQDLFGDDQ